MKDSFYDAVEQRQFAIEVLTRLKETETDIEIKNCFEIALGNLGAESVLNRTDDVGYGFRKIASDIDNLYDKLDYTLKAYGKLNKRMAIVMSLSIIVNVLLLIIILGI